MDSMRSAFARDVGGIEVLFADYKWHRFPPHFHEAYSISVTIHGGLTFNHKGARHVAGTGIISAIDPGEVHDASPAVDDGWSFLCLLVPAETLIAACEAAGGRGVPGFAHRVIADHAMARRVADLARVLADSSDPLERESTALATLGELAARHSTAAAPRAIKTKGAIGRARRMIDEESAGRLSLAELAGAAGLSPFHFIRTFRAAFGVTPHAYQNTVRVMRARMLLREGAPLAHVAQACGFCDQSHLGRAFKAELGVTPGRFQAGVAVGPPPAPSRTSTSVPRIGR